MMLMRFYYWFLFYLGFRDKDGNIKTDADRDKITFMLRRSQRRMKETWWIVSLLTMYLVGYWSLRIWPSWWNILSLALFVFLNWLFIHVCLPASFTQKQLGQDY